MRLPGSLRTAHVRGNDVHRLLQVLARLCATRHDGCNDHSPQQVESTLYTDRFAAPPNRLCQARRQHSSNVSLQQTILIMLP